MTSALSEAANGGRTDQRYRQQLRDILARDAVSSSDRIQQILQLGTARYGVELGLLVRIDEEEGTYTIDEVSTSHPDLTRGLTGDLLSTYCRMVVTEREPLGIDNAPDQSWGGNPAYRSSLLSTYIGTAVTIGDTVYGAVCFVDLDPRDSAFDDADCSFLEHLTQAIGQILEDEENVANRNSAPAPTERTADEQRYRRSRTLLDQAQRLAGAWEVDLRTEAVTWSETLYKIHEVPPGTDIDLDDALAFFLEDDRAKLERAFEQCIEDGTSYDLELRLVTGANNQRWVRTVGAPAEVDPGGNVVKVAGAFQDITDRKEEERKREQVIRRVTDAIVEVDANWRFTLVNDQAEALYDMQEKDLLGKHFWDVFGEALGTQFEDTYRGVMNTREPASLVEYYPELDGWFDITAYPNDDGGVAFYFQEITERKQREARLRDLSNSIPGVVFQFYARPDETYGNYFVSEHAEDVLGISPDTETFFERCLERIPDSHRDAFRASIEEAIEEERAWEFEAPFDKPSGERRWILGRSIPRERAGEVVFNGVFLDITDRKEAERKLQESERRFRKVFKNAAIGIVIGDEDGRLLQANPAFQSMVGYEEAELQTLGFSDLTHPDDIASDQDLFAELTSGKRSRYQVEKRFVRKSGETFWGRTTASQLDLGEKTKHVRLVENIDDQKHYEAKLREAKQEAEEAAQLKSVMLANMSHEVRTPLTSMIGFSGLLRNQLDGKAAKLARLVQKSGQRLEETMEAVLELSQLEAGSYEPDRQTICLASLARQLADEFELQAKEDEITLTVEIDDEPVETYADETAVRRIISNLLDNALKFTPEGGRVTLRVRPENAKTVVLAVEDTGVGIAEEALPGVFDAFKQESEGLTREYEGAGLGLSIVQKLVETLGGRIEVDSEKGKGTCIAVYLPQTSGAALP